MILGVARRWRTTKGPLPPKNPRPQGRSAAIASRRSRDRTSRCSSSSPAACSSTGASTCEKTPKKTARQACKLEFQRSQDKFKGSALADSRWQRCSGCRRRRVDPLFPSMARASRLLMNVPVLSAVLERDFSSAGRLITECQSRLDAAYAEMVILLNLGRGHIPDEVPALSPEQAQDADPDRFRTPRNRFESCRRERRSRPET